MVGFVSKIRGLFLAGLDCARSFQLIQTCGAWHLGSKDAP
ncbi:hypothetical protein F6453_3415 [Marinobacter nauticus]|uniref:Uncharacterized protein n=1 Tax=Marinobacter nauticus TaxID=2743 RepID=A0A833JM05_MARNT|nr:hypothetical protein F6453_3415 [Marinobacter nauticus]